MRGRWSPQFGMTERLGPIKFGQENGEVFLGRDMGHQRDYSEEVAAVVDEEVKKLVSAAHDEAWEILVENRDVLDELVLALLDKETLGKDEVAEIFSALRASFRATGLGGFQPPYTDRPPPVRSPRELASANGNGSTRTVTCRRGRRRRRAGASSQRPIVLRPPGGGDRPSITG